jgi:hypothetical protein
MLPEADCSTILQDLTSEALQEDCAIIIVDIILIYEDFNPIII